MYLAFKVRFSKKKEKFVTTWMAIMEIVEILNCLSININNFFRFGPRHSVTVIVSGGISPLHTILGTPVPLRKSISGLSK